MRCAQRSGAAREGHVACLTLQIFWGFLRFHDSLAERSKAVAQGAIPKGCGFEPHSCQCSHRKMPFSVRDSLACRVPMSARLSCFAKGCEETGNQSRAHAHCLPPPPPKREQKGVRCAISWSQ